jgi:hypothetical protein
MVSSFEERLKNNKCLETKCSERHLRKMDEGSEQFMILLRGTCDFLQVTGNIMLLEYGMDMKIKWKD